MSAGAAAAVNDSIDGRYWERRASAYLRRRGLRILATGYRCRFGELDLVCAEGPTLVIVEVRARRRGSLVTALASIDAAKRRKLIRTARHLLMTRPQWRERPVRFDVVAIDAADAPEPRVEWVRGAFESA